MINTDTKCEMCNRSLKTSYTKLTKQHFLCCKGCLSNINLCSKSKCKTLFLLNNTDLVNLQCLYIKNPNDKSVYYRYNDVLQVALNKYGSVLKINELKKQSVDLQKRRLLHSDKKKQNRKEQLVTLLKNNKLEIDDYGDCYSYVNWGKPSIDNVLINQLKRTFEMTDKKIKLARALTKNNVQTDLLLDDIFNTYKYKSVKQCVKDLQKLNHDLVVQFD